MIRAICFDMDGVYFTSDSFKTFKKEVEKIKKTDTTTDEVFHGEKMQKFKRGKQTEEEYWAYVNRSFGLNLSIEEYSQLLSDSYKTNNEVVEYVKEIKKEGYKTCICTNNFKTRIDTLQKKFHFLDYFDVQVISFQIGYLKPEKEIFDFLIYKSQVKTNEIFFSDDKEETLTTAKKLGIETFLFTSFQEFKNKITDLGVVF